MGGSFKIGRAFGIDVKVHWSFFLLLAFFGYLTFRNSGSLVDALVTVGIVVALFLCVLLHEYGHSLVAIRLGSEVQDITLLPIGGLARMKSLPERPIDEVKVAVAGPLVNVVLAPIFFGLALLFGGSLSVPPGILSGFFTNNFLLAIIGFFVFLGASGEAGMVRQREQMRGLTVSDVMGTKGRTETVTPYHNFGQILDSVIHGYQEDFPVLDE